MFENLFVKNFTLKYKHKTLKQKTKKKWKRKSHGQKNNKTSH